MPQNNELKITPRPIDMEWNQEPVTEFSNNIDSIKLTLSTDLDRQYIADYCLATWSNTPYKKKSDEQLTELMIDLFKGHYLPTALELIRLNFIIEGITIQEATHLLRYRGMSFSAECSDKSWRHKRALIPGKIIDSEFLSRYQVLVEECKTLYADMLDSREISVLDARSILPRCLETFYFVSMNMKDAIHFIKQRLDEMIQPETDNVIAMLMYKLIRLQIPEISYAVKPTPKSEFYINQYKNGLGTNLYTPNAETDTFDYNRENCVYKFGRERHESKQFKKTKEAFYGLHE